MAAPVTQSPGTMADVGPIVDSYSESNYNNVDFYVNANGEAFELGQSFTVSSSDILTSVKFYLSKQASATGTIRAKLYAHSGTYGTSSIPTGSALAVSNDINVSDLSTSLGLITFNFSGANQYALEGGTNYIIAIDGSSISATKSVYVGSDSSSPTHGGNGSANYYGTWDLTDVQYYDLCFYIYSDAPGTVAWSNPDNAKVSDNVYATVSLGISEGQ